jgi:peptide-methionine (R)-S-oxide reductase
MNLATVLLGFALFWQPATQPSTRPAEPEKIDKLVLTDAQWREKLSPEQYVVLRNKGTEAPGTCALLNVHERGTFICAGCHLPLFASDEKFDSGTGWPSFTTPIPGHVYEMLDRTHGMLRQEVLCSKCDGHLGHVFDDGPPPTGKRYCMNGVAMKFVPAGEELPK